ncbi:MAG TPA: hypothetical protein VFB79_06350 [Candidatus Angelobacter sp.]|nr:hypothetical protein [Candidatus Angelobacter sp.]
MKHCILPVALLAIVCLTKFFTQQGEATAQATQANAATDGLWVDLTHAYRLLDSSHTWICSTHGWLYLAAEGSSSSDAITCTTPLGNDLSWGGGFISNLRRAGNHISFDRSNGIFGRSDTGCHIEATITAGEMKGTQTCKLKYTSPLSGRSAEATVQGPWEAGRGSFAAANLTSVDCARESSLRRPNVAGAAMVLFENRSSEPLSVYVIGLNGQRVLPPDHVPPHGTLAEAVPESSPLVLTNASGTCKAIYIPSVDAAKAAMP